ncbi:hypothetical protein tb265_31140 [Gemmatimonadetes bacterium T265]|nr:hypothetical protein tb265_31140 [Gemmatimonadetes bacterium T265]
MTTQARLIDPPDRTTVVHVTRGTESDDRPNVFVEIVRDIISHRELLWQLTRRDITIRYKQAAMGFLWAVLIPTIVVLAGVVVRFGMAVASGTSLPKAEIGGIMVKALPWSFFVGSINFATASLLGNMNLVTKVAFPREVLPLSSVLAQMFDMVIAGVGVAVALCFVGGTLSVQLLWAPVMLLLLLTFTTAVCLFLSCANLFFRDVKYLVQVFVTFGIFFTPVFFDAGTFGAKGARILMINPLAPILEGLRLSVVQGHNLLEPLTVHTHTGAAVAAWHPWYLLYAAVWAIGGLVLSALLFHRAEDTFAEYI